MSRCTETESGRANGGFWRSWAKAARAARAEKKKADCHGYANLNVGDTVDGSLAPPARAESDRGPLSAGDLRGGRHRGVWHYPAGEARAAAVDGPHAEPPGADSAAVPARDHDAVGADLCPPPGDPVLRPAGEVSALGRPHGGGTAGALVHHHVRAPGREPNPLLRRAGGERDARHHPDRKPGANGSRDPGNPGVAQPVGNSDHAHPDGPGRRRFSGCPGIAGHAVESVLGILCGDRGAGEAGGLHQTEYGRGGVRHRHRLAFHHASGPWPTTWSSYRTTSCRRPS